MGILYHGAFSRTRNPCKIYMLSDSCKILNCARNFGIVKHPGVGSSPAAIPKPPTPSAEQSLSAHNAETSSESSRKRRPSSARNDSTTAQELLKTKGFLPVLWHGNCEAEKVSMGTYGVPEGHGGMYGLVFDNTFSKTTSKTATFVLLTYPSNAPPNTSHHNLQGAPSSMSSAVSIGSRKESPKFGATAAESVDSLPSSLGLGAGTTRNRSTSVLTKETTHSKYHVGILHKRRRKRGQGYARRYFSLDYASCTLSYYYNARSSALRGAIPLSLAAISADERRREISIDSGAEIWHLRALNAKDFEEWTSALELASSTARGLATPMNSATARPRITTTGPSISAAQADPEEDRDWARVEALVSQTVGIRDAVRRLATDTHPEKRRPPSSFGLSGLTPPAVPEEGKDYFGPAEKKSFWSRRKVSASTPGRERNISPNVSGSSSSGITTTITTNGGMLSPLHRRTSSRQERSIHDHCESLLKDLDSVLTEFSILLANSKRRRLPAPKSTTLSRNSIDSEFDEFYDAEDRPTDGSPLVMIQRMSEEDTPESEDDEFVSDGSSISSTEDDTVLPAQEGEASFFPPKPKALTPLPISKTIKRRNTVPPTNVLPPSLISFLRKNVGKDLSTISMPVSANEPLSLLQRLSEGLEYASLLDTAATLTNPAHRLAHVAAFAVSYFSCTRAKERSIRKPFNPMLGETYELVRGEAENPGGFRFLAEKVSHRPVKMACQADSPNWTFMHSPMPTQKFWGKSVELITEGRVRVVLRLGEGNGEDERYSWSVATMFLRNIVMGEKYAEPVGSMTVLNETSGAKAVVEFKSKGMFGGRAEDVAVETYDASGRSTGISLVGMWTSAMKMMEGGKGSGQDIWKVGKLVDGAETRYGFTEFATGLNEITDVEDGKLPVTDSRFRKDQRAAEGGKLDLAEECKLTLEEAQRQRRKDLEARGEEWSPRWFSRVDTGEGGEEVWRLKTGNEGYWGERAKGSWTDVEDVLCMKSG